MLRLLIKFNSLSILHDTWMFILACTILGIRMLDASKSTCLRDRSYGSSLIATTVICSKSLSFSTSNTVLRFQNLDHRSFLL